MLVGDRHIDLATTVRQSTKKVNMTRALLLLGGLSCLLLEHLLVVGGHNTHEAGKEVMELVNDMLSDG